MFIYLWIPGFLRSLGWQKPAEASLVVKELVWWWMVSNVFLPVREEAQILESLMQCIQRIVNKQFILVTVLPISDAKVPWAPSGGMLR